MNTIETPRRLIERVAEDLSGGGLPSLDRLARVDRSSPAGDTSTARPVNAKSIADLVHRSAASIVGTPEHPQADKVEDAPPSPPGTVLSIAALEGIGMRVLQARRDGVGEDFRLVRQQVLSRLEDPQRNEGQSTPSLANTVLVTSALGGEGKSFAALNLAGILAEGGRRPVVLVDADFRTGSLTHGLGLTDQPGLLDLGVSPMQLARAYVVASQMEGLSFLPVGGGADPDTRIAASAKQPIRPLIERIAAGFGDAIVVIDTAACLESADPAELAGAMGQTVVVVEAGRTRRQDIEAALDRLDDCPNLSLLLNRASPRSNGFLGLWR